MRSVQATEREPQNEHWVPVLPHERIFTLPEHGDFTVGLCRGSTFRQSLRRSQAGWQKETQCPAAIDCTLISAKIRSGDYKLARDLS